MITHYCPPFVTETDEATWTDCQWAAGLMLALKASHGAMPATRAEREALREASGDYMGGSSLADLNRGLRTRYGRGVALNRISAASLEKRLVRGDGADVNLLYARLPDHWTRWDRHFAAKGSRSAHAAYVQAEDRGGNVHLTPSGRLHDVFWQDPLGRSPAGTDPHDRYRGEWLPFEALVEAMAALSGSTARLIVATLSDHQWT